MHRSLFSLRALPGTPHFSQCSEQGPPEGQLIMESAPFAQEQSGKPRVPSGAYLAPPTRPACETITAAAIEILPPSSPASPVHRRSCRGRVAGEAASGQPGRRGGGGA